MCFASPLAGVARAQTAAPEPLPLVPQKALGAAPGPGAELGAPSDQAGLSTAVPKTGARGIEVNPLADIAPEAIGTLGPEDGGFGLDMWNGTSREVIEGLLQRVPARMASRAMRGLTRRLLLSVAPPPAARPRALASAATDTQGPAARAAAMPNRLLVLRAQRLAELGEVPALISLLSAVPAHAENETLDRLHVEALFLSHDLETACRLVRNGIAIHHERPFWQKAMIFCNMASGELDRGMLGLDLMREQGVGDDPLFFTLATRFLGIEDSLPDVETLSPLHFAMLRAADLPLPAAALDQAAPGLLYAIATDTKLDPLQQAAAAEVACAQGLLDGADLARSYEALSFTASQLGNPIRAAAGLEGPAARALLYQAVRREILPATRAEILRVALDQAVEDGLFPAAAELYRTLVADIDPAPQLSWFAASAGRALYGAGEHSRANAWLALGRQEAIINSQASTAVAALWPYARLAGGESFTTNGSLNAWHDMREAAGDVPPAGARVLLRTAFQALGEQDPVTWGKLAAYTARQDAQADRPVPSAAFLYALQDASEARRLGETVLLSLIVLGEAGPAEAHDMALGAVLGALVRVGLEREARLLAIEAALAKGV